MTPEQLRRTEAVRCGDSFTCPSGAVLRCGAPRNHPGNHVYSHPGIPQETHR